VEAQQMLLQQHQEVLEEVGLMVMLQELLELQDKVTLEVMVL